MELFNLILPTFIDMGIPSGFDPSLSNVLGRSNSYSSDTVTSSATNTTTTTDTASTTDLTQTQSQSASYWDMLCYLLSDSSLDFQMFVWWDTVFVQAIPPQSSAVLWLDDKLNIEEGTVSITQGNVRTAYNKVIVKYGDGVTPLEAVATNSQLLKQAGKEIVKTFDDVKNKWDIVKAKNFAENELNKLVREQGFQMECTAIGHPEWYIGRWTRAKHERYNIDDNYYITRIDNSLSGDQAWRVNLTLKEYAPKIKATGSGGGTGKTGDVSAILKEAAKFTYCSACQDAACMETTGCGSCWAMSEYLFNKIKATGISVRIVQYATELASNHRSVQIKDSTGNWVDVDYHGAGINYLFSANDTKPGMFVYANFEG